MNIKPSSEDGLTSANGVARLISQLFHPLLLWNGTVCGLFLLARPSLQALTISGSLLVISFVSVITALRLPKSHHFGLLSTTPNQSDRVKPRFFLPVLLGLILSGAICYALAAPRPIQIYCGITLAIAALSMWLSRWVRVSGHVAAITGTSLLATVLLGSVALPALVFIPIVAWARLHLRLHTMVDIVAGNLIGALATAAFCLLSRLQ